MLLLLLSKTILSEKNTISALTHTNVTVFQIFKKKKNRLKKVSIIFTESDFFNQFYFFL